jgi:pentapeptide repeat protein
MIGSDLKRADLREADLRGVSLETADLRQANLEGADLQEAILAMANLSEANLERANLTGADLTQACLLGANLRDAQLEGSVLWAAYYDGRTRWPDDFDPEQVNAVRLGEKLKPEILSAWEVHNYGPHMVIDGYITEPGEDEYQHRFGGSRWQIVAPGGAGEKSVLLLTLDLRDPRLSVIRIPGLDELPLVCPLAWLNSLEGTSLRIDPKTRVVHVEPADPAEAELPPDEYLIPNPLPETCVRLRPMTIEDCPIDSESFYRIWGEIEGKVSGKFIRVLGPPLWIQNPIRQTCSCGAPMPYIACIGSDNLRQPAPYLPGGAFNFWGGILHYFLCKECRRLVAEMQCS